MAFIGAFIVTNNSICSVKKQQEKSAQAQQIPPNYRAFPVNQFDLKLSEPD